MTQSKHYDFAKCRDNIVSSWQHPMIELRDLLSIIQTEDKNAKIETYFKSIKYAPLL